jgi:hypothetical protein
VPKYTKLLIALSHCEHKKYAIADIFLQTPKGFTNHRLAAIALEYVPSRPNCVWMNIIEYLVLGKAFSYEESQRRH